jgi:hypothetical protein
MWSKDRKDGDSDDSEEDEEEDSEEDSDEDEDGEPKDAEATREARKAQKKARKEAAIAKQKSKTVEVGDMPSSDESEEDDDDDMPANPNHSKAARDMAKAAAVPGSGDVEGITEGVASMGAPNRKAREAQEAAAAKEKYMKLHAAGKTDEAKADLERLKVIREQRAAEAARRQVRTTALCADSIRAAVQQSVLNYANTLIGRKGREGREGQGA